MRKTITVFLILLFFCIFPTENLLSKIPEAGEMEVWTRKKIHLRAKLGLKNEAAVDPPYNEDNIDAFIEGNFLSLTFSEAPADETIQVRIINEYGQTVDNVTIMVTSAGEVIFFVDVEESEEYYIELNSTDINVEGEF